MSETIPEFDGCPWPMDPACRSAEWEAYDEDVQARALALASVTLTRLTGGRVTNCPSTVRPGPQNPVCVPLAARFDLSSPLGPNAWGWQSSTYAAPDPRRVTLPGPVGALYEVQVEGLALDLDLFRTEGNDLVYLGALPVPWPEAPDMYSTLGEPDTWSVTYLQGYPVDAMGAYAVGILAQEFAKACTNGKCRLPAGVTSLVRQGVSIEIIRGSFPDGFTGIKEIDAFISLWNPNANKFASTVWTPKRTPTTVKVPLFTDALPGGVEDGGGP